MLLWSHTYSLFVRNLLYAAVYDCTLVGQLDAEFTYREIFFECFTGNVEELLKMHGGTLFLFSTGSLCFHIKVSVEILFADCPWSYFQETLTFLDFYIAMHS